MVRQLVPHLTAAILVLSCSTAALAQGTSTTRDSVAAAMRAYLEAIRSNDARTVASWWTDDAAYVHRSAPTIRGRVALESLLRSFFAATPVTAVSEHTEEILVDGNVAIQMGTYSETTQAADSRAFTEEGRYVFVWRRQPQGGWKIARAMATDLPARPPRQ